MAGISVTDVYDSLLSTTLKNYSRQLRDNIFLKFPFLNWLLSKKKSRPMALVTRGALVLNLVALPVGPSPTGWNSTF